MTACRWRRRRDWAEKERPVEERNKDRIIPGIKQAGKSRKRDSESDRDLHSNARKITESSKWLLS